jgi:predicted Zn-dependent protease
VDGETVDAPAGAIVFLPDPGARRAAIAKEPGTIVLAVGGKRGEPYRVSPWEFYGAAMTAYEAGDFDGAAELTGEGLAEHPDHPSILYNLACFEALAGHREQALEHVRRAVELDPENAARAASDPDFDSVRDDPAFPR